MTTMTTSDRIRFRSVGNRLNLVREHLEAMQRDVHGLEYAHWKEEVDQLWKGIFEQISRMSEGPQRSSLELIRDDWTQFLQYYATLSE
jgi:hypothetical protein|tara:strand:- start:131 stop:394 length:264 start_codon:yes stop_codon:yes gene_type:complete